MFCQKPVFIIDVHTIYGLYSTLHLVYFNCLNSLGSQIIVPKYIGMSMNEHINQEITCAIKDTKSMLCMNTF